MGVVTVNPVQTSTYDLNASANPITFGAGTNINAVSPYTIGVYGGFGTTWNVTNYGSIQATNGVVLGGGTIDNKTGGRIIGVNNGVDGLENATVTVINAGKITAATSGNGVLLTHGTVNNLSGGIISGGGGVMIESGDAMVTNAGAISGTATVGESVGVALGGGTVDNESGGTVTGVSFGVTLTGTVDNQSGGTISGSTGVAGVATTVTNYGHIYGTGANRTGANYGIGVLLFNGGTVNNFAGAKIDLQYSGVDIASGAGSVTNSGAISGGTNSGVELLSGGTVNNQSRGTISGGNFGVYITGGSGSVTNAGAISGGASVEFGGPGANTLTLKTGSVLTGDAIGSTASGATNALVLQGTGTAANNFDNFNTLTVKASGTWTLGGDSTIGAATVSSSATLTVTGDLDVTGNFANAHDVLVSSGTLDLQGAATGKGTDEVSAASTLEFGSTVTGNVVDFMGGPSAVDLLDPTGFSGKFENFASMDTVDLAGDWIFHKFRENAGATVGTLTLESVATNTDLSLKFEGDYSRSDFTITSGATTTTITHT